MQSTTALGRFDGGARLDAGCFTRVWVYACVVFYACVVIYACKVDFRGGSGVDGLDRGWLFWG